MSITLDTALDVNSAFATLSEADVYLEVNTSWNSLSDENKNLALVYSRFYLEGKVNCVLEGAIPDELKLANSILASDYASDTNVFSSSKNIKVKKVKAGSVSSETEFSGSEGNNPPSWNVVKSILQEICPGILSNTAYIIRA